MRPLALLLACCACAHAAPAPAFRDPPPWTLDKAAVDCATVEWNGVASCTASFSPGGSVSLCTTPGGWGHAYPLWDGDGWVYHGGGEPATFAGRWHVEPGGVLVLTGAWLRGDEPAAHVYRLRMAAPERGRATRGTPLVDDGDGRERESGGVELRP